MLRFWEHEVHERLAACVDAVARALVAPATEPPALHYRVVKVEPLSVSEHECRYLSELRDAAPPHVVQRARSTKKWSTRAASIP